MANRFQLGYQTPPLVARQAGFCKLVKDTRFDRLNSIDMADTGANGFDWYRRLAFTAGAAVPGQAGWATFPTNPAANFSIVNGNLAITGGSTSNLAMGSACQNISDPRGYSGHMYGGGFYAEADMSFNNGTFGGAAFWAIAKSFLLGTVGTAPGAVFAEIDFMEVGDLGGGGVTPTHSGMVRWHADTGKPDGGPMHQTPGDYGDGTIHNWAFRWLTAAQNNGTTNFSFYLDGALTFSVTPTLNVDDDAFIIYFNGGFGTTVKRVKVWQHFDTPGD